MHPLTFVPLSQYLTELIKIMHHFSYCTLQEFSSQMLISDKTGDINKNVVESLITNITSSTHFNEQTIILFLIVKGDSLLQLELMSHLVLFPWEPNIEYPIIVHVYYICQYTI